MKYTTLKKMLITAACCIGICLGSFGQNTGIGTSTATHKLTVVGAPPTSTNATIYGTNTGNTGNGILGVSNNVGTYGVVGSSTLGTAVQGYTNIGYAMAGVSIAGIAVQAQSLSGYGLIGSGKLKFSGGNTNPSNGALLTSDATGNAVWQRSGISFFANGGANAIGEALTKVEFSNEAFDKQNNFAPYAGVVSPGSSVFTAPVSGVYHFSAAVLFEKTGVPQYSNYMLNGYIALLQDGSMITQSNASHITHQNAGGTYSNYVYLTLDTDMHLNANDKVWIVAKNDQNGDHVATAVPLNSSSFNCRFSGELLFAD